MIKLENCGIKEKLFVVRWEDHSVLTKVFRKQPEGYPPLAIRN